MSSLFIIGNGFDIAHGIPTKYRDFREFIIKSYPEAIKYRDEVTFIEDIADVDTEEFAAEILLSTMDKVAGDDWTNFEEALAYVNFDHKFPLPNHKENETEEEDNELMKNYLLYMDMLTSGYIPQEDSRTNSKEMKKLLGYMARHHEDLEKSFTDEQKEIFEKFHDCWSEYMSLAEEAIFTYAFRLGMQIALDSILTE